MHFQFGGDSLMLAGGELGIGGQFDHVEALGLDTDGGGLRPRVFVEPSERHTAEFRER